MNLGSRFFGNIIRQFLRVPSAQRFAFAEHGAGAGVDSVGEQKKLEARKLLDCPKGLCKVSAILRYAVLRRSSLFECGSEEASLKGQVIVSSRVIIRCPRYARIDNVWIIGINPHSNRLPLLIL